MSGDEVRAASRALSIEYAIRDVVVPATALEAEGHQILKLNIGDPIAYPGLPTPPHMVEAYAQAVRDGMNGYSPSYGLPELREAVAADERSKGWPATSDDIYVCHGVTEALQLLFAGVLEEGDVVLAPGPHYPPYMAYPQMYGAHTVEYGLDANDGWRIDLEDLASKMSDDVRFVVLINPNNPTGNVASPAEIDAVLEIVSNWPQCMVIADEIYDGLDFTGQQVSVASRSTSVPVITLNGVSKVYFAPGWRIGWFGLHDPESRLASVREALERLLRSRLCASTPAQRGYLAGLTGDRSWMGPYAERVKAQ
ncbi:MAG: aminotransferase class I/II-fold pyridoxal phosphate-dependent enzyme, partial [Candidatus Poseidoniaceae archaeon]|nr:aminotransferase class I/II-fold pyridoxal phosphate-dependent enzyme [Candidatus Poseidoniaceae archaeon]